MSCKEAKRLLALPQSNLFAQLRRSKLEGIYTNSIRSLQTHIWEPTVYVIVNSLPIQEPSQVRHCQGRTACVGHDTKHANDQNRSSVYSLLPALRPVLGQFLPTNAWPNSELYFKGRMLLPVLRYQRVAPEPHQKNVLTPGYTDDRSRTNQLHSQATSKTASPFPHFILV